MSPLTLCLCMSLVLATVHANREHDENEQYQASENTLAPFFVRVLSDSGICGGIVLRRDIILTASPCAGYNDRTIMTRGDILEGSVQQFNVKRVCHSEKLGMTLLPEGYAILVLKKKLLFNKHEIFGPLQTGDINAVKCDSQYPDQYRCFQSKDTAAEPGDGGNPIVVERGQDFQLVGMVYAMSKEKSSLFIGIDIQKVKGKMSGLIRRCLN